MLTAELQSAPLNSGGLNNRLKSEGLFPWRFTRFNSRRNYIKTDFIVARNVSKINRIWEYPEDKDLVPLSGSLWQMEDSEAQEAPRIDVDLDGQIEKSDLLTSKSKATDFSKKESDKSHRLLNDKDKGSLRAIDPQPAKGYEMGSSEKDLQRLSQSTSDQKRES